MAHYLVTGGAGFIGSHLAEELVRRGERVRVVDSLITGKRQNSPTSAGASSSKATWPISTSPGDAVQGIDYVLHQAAIPSVPRSVQDPITSNRANIDASLNVLVAARDAGVQAASSTPARRRRMATRRRCPRSRRWPTAPLSPYALQKLVAEQYCQMFTPLYGLETVTTRYFNVFGPRQDPSSPYSGRDLAVHQRALRRPAADIYGDGEHTRDFTYVANVVDGVLRACTAPGASGEVINVATGWSHLAQSAVSHRARSDRRRRRARLRRASCG